MKLHWTYQAAWRKDRAPTTLVMLSQRKGTAMPGKRRPRTYDHDSAMYINAGWRRSTYWQLLGSGVHYFKRAARVEHFVELKNKVARQFTRRPDGQPNWQDFRRFTSETLIDAIKISLAFENYQKGRLIQKGYLVHHVDTKVGEKKFKPLGDINKAPVKVSALKAIEGYKKDRTTGHFGLRGIKDTTVGFRAIMTKPEYRELIPLPRRVHDLVMWFHGRRNRLHLLAGEGAMYNQALLDDLATLISYVNKHMIKRHNRLAEHFKKEHAARFFEAEIPLV